MQISKAVRSDERVILNSLSSTLWDVARALKQREPGSTSGFILRACEQSIPEAAKEYDSRLRQYLVVGDIPVHVFIELPSAVVTERFVKFGAGVTDEVRKTLAAGGVDWSR